jgi:hypothetical protein
VDVMMRIVTAAMAILTVLAGISLLPVTVAQAQTAPNGVQATQPSEASTQRRPLRRLPIYPRREWEPEVYPRYYPGRNAVRDCTASYVQEYRPSGTVIVPHVNCFWRRG